MDEIRRAMEGTGLGDKAARVYLGLLQMGEANATDLARHTGLKRPTVYDMIADLADKGLVGERRVGKRRRFVAESPRRLLDLPKRQEEAIKAVLPDLQSYFRQRASRPVVRYYEGIAGLRQINEDLLRTTSGAYHYLGSAEDFIESLGVDYLRRFVERRVAAGIWSNAIRWGKRETRHDFLSDGDRWMRRLRLLPDSSTEDVVSYYIYDHKVAFIASLRECYGLIIESPDLATVMMRQWRILWGVARG